MLGIILNPKVTTWDQRFRAHSPTLPPVRALPGKRRLPGTRAIPRSRSTGYQSRAESCQNRRRSLARACVLYQLRCGSVHHIVMSRGALTSYTAPVAVADSVSVSNGLVISSSVTGVSRRAQLRLFAIPAADIPCIFRQHFRRHFHDVTNPTCFVSCERRPGYLDRAFMRPMHSAMATVIPATSPRDAPGGSRQRSRRSTVMVGNYITCVPVISW